jgi:hypothetical protein
MTLAAARLQDIRVKLLQIQEQFYCFRLSCVIIVSLSLSSEPTARTPPIERKSLLLVVKLSILSNPSVNVS